MSADSIKELVKRLRERYSRRAAESNDEARLRRQLERDDAADALEAMAGEVDALQNTFDLMWKADQRAIKLWQEATGKDHIWPDRTKTALWLLERAEAAESERDRLQLANARMKAALEKFLAEADNAPKRIIGSGIGGQTMEATLQRAGRLVSEWQLGQLEEALGGAS